MKCSFCGQDNLMGAQFCDNCGANLKTSSSQNYTVARLEPAPPPIPLFPARPSAPAYSTPSAPAAPAYSTPSAPAAPAYSTPSSSAASAYSTPSAPVAPAYSAPSAPAAPAYSAPSAPAPAYSAPSVPAAPVYSVLSAPVPAYNTPASLTSTGRSQNMCGYASLKDEYSGQVFQISADTILLGRGPALPGEGVKLDFEGLRGGSTVSKKHAYLRRDSTGLAIEDIGSGNGTYINDERLMPGVERFLNSGDRLRLGAVRFIVGILNKK